MIGDIPAIKQMLNKTSGSRCPKMGIDGYLIDVKQQKKQMWYIPENVKKNTANMNNKDTIKKGVTQ